jgi:hypothetical protein
MVISKLTVWKDAPEKSASLRLEPEKSTFLRKEPEKLAPLREAS